MTRRKTNDLVCYLEDRECGEVLAQLLKRRQAVGSIRKKTLGVRGTGRKGIVVGLYRVEKSGGGKVVECAPDFPLETAAYTVSTLVKMYPTSRRRAAGRRIIEGVEQQCGEWVKVFQRVVREVTPSGKRTRKRR